MAERFDAHDRLLASEAAEVLTGLVTISNLGGRIIDLASWRQPDRNTPNLTLPRPWSGVEEHARWEAWAEPVPLTILNTQEILDEVRGLQLNTQERLDDVREGQSPLLSSAAQAGLSERAAAYEDLLPWTTGEREFMYRTVQQGWDLDSASNSITRIRNTSGFAVSQGRTQKMSGANLLDRWWDWRRGTGDYRRGSSAPEAHELFVGMGEALQTAFGWAEEPWRKRSERDQAERKRQLDEVHVGSVVEVTDSAPMAD